MALPSSLSIDMGHLTAGFNAQTFQQLSEALVQTEDQSAMLSLHGAQGVGGVFIDEGRIAWAAAPGTRRFLSHRLVAAGVSEDAMHGLLEEARTSGAPLGRMVVDRGLMSANTFAEVLFEHTVVSLGLMASQPLERIEHHNRRGGTFELATTFPMVPLLAESVRRVVKAPWREAAGAGEDLIAVEIAVVDQQALPVRVLGPRAPKLSELRSLAGDALAVMSDIGAGTVSFRRGASSWSVSGNQSSFVVSEGRSALSFSWMLAQSGA